MSETDHHAPPGVTVLPGVPNMPGLKVDDGVVPFPDTTTDFVKLIRQRGIQVEYAVPKDQRVYVGHKAFELWVPILEFTQDLLMGIEGGLLVELLMSYIRPTTDPSRPEDLERFDEDTEREHGAAPGLLHVEWHVSKPDGTRETFVANGGTDDVLDALKQFEQHVRDDEGQ